MNTNLILLIILGGLIGAFSGYLGTFMILKRMSLVGDALSHVALPGIAIAVFFGINSMLGAIIALTLATIGVWYMAEKSQIYPEALFGILFTASLALGILLTPEPEMFEVLFGNIDKITNFDGLIIIIGAIVIFVLTKLISKKLMLGIVSEDLAKAQKINISKINLVYLLLVGLVVTLGVKFLGTLLTGALVIIPAVTARNISKSIKSFHILSIVFGIITATFGIIIARVFGIASGPTVVLVGIFLFVISFFGFFNKNID